MREVDPERTKLRFSIPQLCTIIGAIVLCTWRVNETLNELRTDIRNANEKAALAWSVDDQNLWVWLANKRNPQLQLPYPVELKAFHTSGQ